jgi:hypothetical protein
VRAMIRPNKVSEIRSIGSSTLRKGLSDTSDISIKRPWLDLRGRFADYLQPPEQTFLHKVGAKQSIGYRSAIEP